MQPCEIIGLINELEEKFQVHTWKAAGFHFWPAIRIPAVFSLQYIQYKNASDIDNSGLVASRIRRLSEIVFRSFTEYDLFRSCHNSQIVCLSDGVSFQELNGLFWDKFIDPLKEKLVDKGISCVCLNPSGRDYVPGRSRFINISHKISWAAICSSLIKRCIRKELKKNLLLGDFYKELEKRSLEKYFLDFDGLCKMISHIRTAADFFKDLLKKASLGIQVSYYQQTGYAFNLACKELEIPCVDIQHGITGSEHPAYGSWCGVPSHGYEILPSIFWSWEDNDVQTIVKWAGQDSPYHKAFAAGHPLNSLLLSEKEGVFSGYFENVCRLAGRGHNRNVLISLQPVFINEDVLESFLQAIKASPEDTQWWIRPHPCNTEEEIARAKKSLSAGHDRRIIFEEATANPLISVLAYMDFHITHCSSVILEALNLGVPSAVIDPFGYEIFRDVIDNRMVFFCPSPDSWPDVFEKAFSTGRNADSNFNCRLSAGVEMLISLMKKL